MTHLSSHYVLQEVSVNVHENTAVNNLSLYTLQATKKQYC